MSRLLDMLAGDHVVPARFRMHPQEGPVVHYTSVLRLTYPGLTHCSRLNRSADVGVGKGRVDGQQGTCKSSHSAR